MACVPGNVSGKAGCKLMTRFGKDERKKEEDLHPAGEDDVIGLFGGYVVSELGIILLLKDLFSSFGKRNRFTLYSSRGLTQMHWLCC